MHFPWSKREPAATGFPDPWRELLDQRMVHWHLLDDDERARLEDDTLWLLATRRWEAARGFALDDTVQVTIAAQAALLILGLHRDAYRRVRTILVHPSTVVLHGERGVGGGLASRSPMPILGQANLNGPVIISWDAARKDARHPERGHNVVYHEFAHQLDMLDGFADGTPPLADRDAMARWEAVCSREYELLRRGEGGTVLRDYGAVNESEFFAVATEAFFTTPVALQAEKTELYDVLSAFYRQDPATRERRAAGGMLSAG